MRTEDDTIPRFSEFSNFVRDLDPSKLTAYHANDIRSLHPLLVFLSEMEGRYSVMTYNLNQICEKLSLISIMKPLVGESYMNRARIRLDIRSMAPISFLTLGNWEDIRVEQIPLELLAFGWGVHASLEQYVFFHHLVSERYSHIHYSANERFEKVLGLINSPVDITSLLREKIAGTEKLKTINVPSLNVVPDHFKLKWRYADDFIDAMGHLMGYVPHFFYALSGAEHNNVNDYFTREYLISPSDSRQVVPINKNDYELHLQKRTLKDTIDLNVANDRLIRFDFPVMLSSKEVRDLNFQEEVPITHHHKDPSIKTGSIYHYYQSKDVYFDPYATDLTFLRTPRYVTEFREKIFEKIEYLSGFHGEVEVLSGYFKPFDTSLLQFGGRY